MYMQRLDRHRLGHIIEYCHRIQATMARFGTSIVAHGYGNIELTVVWRTAQEDIPRLQAFCEKELRSTKCE